MKAETHIHREELYSKISMYFVLSKSKVPDAISGYRKSLSGTSILPQISFSDLKKIHLMITTH